MTVVGISQEADAKKTLMCIDVICEDGAKVTLRSEGAKYDDLHPWYIMHLHSFIVIASLIQTDFKVPA